jgi:hypothetical protein
MSEETQYNIGASIDELVDTNDQFKKSDPFNKTWDELKNLTGLDNNFKRRAARMSKVEASPAYMNSALAISSGRDDAKSKEINPGVLYRNAYGLFDVITPPWNVYELANYYDTSFANHAAIDAKVENIVGLGYKFEISPRTMLKLEASMDTASTERARKSIYNNYGKSLYRRASNRKWLPRNWKNYKRRNWVCWTYSCNNNACASHA